MGGELEVGGVELPLVLTVSEEGDGSLNATVDSPDQGAMGLKVDLIELNDDGVLRFEMKTLSAKFEGKRDELGKTIVGELTQAEQHFLRTRDWLLRPLTSAYQRSD